MRWGGESEDDAQSNSDVYLTHFTLKDLENVATCINIAYSETMAVFKSVDGEARSS